MSSLPRDGGATALGPWDLHKPEEEPPPEHDEWGRPVVRCPRKGCGFVAVNSMGGLKNHLNWHDRTGKVRPAHTSRDRGGKAYHTRGKSRKQTCRECGRTFKSGRGVPGHLKMHDRLRDGERRRRAKGRAAPGRFPCPLADSTGCTRTFAHFGSIGRHQHRMHSGVGAGEDPRFAAALPKARRRIRELKRTDPTYRPRRNAAISRAAQRAQRQPEVRAANSARSTARWKDPDYAAKVVAGMNTPQAKRNRSKAQKQRRAEEKAAGLVAGPKVLAAAKKARRARAKQAKAVSRKIRQRIRRDLRLHGDRPVRVMAEALGLDASTVQHYKKALRLEGIVVPKGGWLSPGEAISRGHRRRQRD